MCDGATAISVPGQRRVDAAHTVVPAPNVRTLRPEVSAVFAAIVSKLLAKDPDHRYQSGEGLVADLERLLVDGGQGLYELGSHDVGVGVSTAGRLLVGRDTELAQLLVRWDKARTGQGGAALVCGAAGAGKSRLVKELVAAVGAGGSLVLHGKSTPDDAMPFGPLRSALERYLTTVSKMPGPPEAQREPKSAPRPARWRRWWHRCPRRWPSYSGQASRTPRTGRSISPMR